MKKPLAEARKLLRKGEAMKRIPDNEVMEYLLAGQVIFAHKAISAGLIDLDEAADLLEMDTNHLLQLFEKLGLSEPEKVMTFEEMLDGSAPREMCYTADEIRSIFLSGEDDC